MLLERHVTGNIEESVDEVLFIFFNKNLYDKGEVGFYMVCNTTNIGHSKNTVNMFTLIFVCTDVDSCSSEKGRNSLLGFEAA